MVTSTKASTSHSLRHSEHELDPAPDLLGQEASSHSHACQRHGILFHHTDNDGTPDGDFFTQTQTDVEHDGSPCGTA